jgi:predicted lysophospholipase L1 biosynthesis ABC-type transport system permease subunit
MKTDWRFAWDRVALTVLGGVALTVLVALAGTWRALGARAAVHLRTE